MKTPEDKGTVSALFLLREKGSGRIEIDAGRFERETGLAGDAYAGPGDRQVPVYCDAGRKRLSEGPDDGLCFARFLETLRLGEIDTLELDTGDLLSSGEAVLEVTAVRKRCFPECPIVARGERCDLARSVRFCRVERDGELRTGAAVTLLRG